MSKYVDNLYRKYLTQEWSTKFQCAGIYSLSINDIIVYVGKSRDILYRMAEHWVSTSTPENNKYSVLAEAKSRNMKIKFDVIYRAKSKRQTEIDEEIGEREGYYIRKHKPPLNYQIPQESNWRKFDVNKTALTITLDDILKEKGGFYFG